MAKRIKKITNPQQIFQSVYGDSSSVIRMAEGGLDWTPKGAAGTAVRVDKGTPILCYNGGAGVAFVAFGAQGMSAPSSAANGIPVLAGQTFILNSGDNEWVRASSASLFVYVGDYDV